MTIRTLVFSIIACASIASSAVFAHPGAHSEDEKLIPTTCSQLNDKKRYTDDVSYPEVKKLKERCEAEKAGNEKSKKSTSQTQD